MASDILDRVAMVITDTGTGDVTANVLISNRFNTPAEAGAVDGKSYWWMLEEGSDYEIFEGVYTASGTKVGRTTVWQSKIAGVHGTTKMTLGGNATLRSITPAEALAYFLRVDQAQSLNSTQKSQGRANLDASSTARTVTVLTSGSGTYPLAAGVKSIFVRGIGAGAGGSGSGASPGNGGTGGNTTFGSLTGAGASAGAGIYGNTGGAASGGDLNLTGGSGQCGASSTASPSQGGGGGQGVFGGGTRGIWAGAGETPPANTGAGGSGGGILSTANGGGGGGAGGYFEKLIISPSSTYNYAIGAGGTAGTAGTGGFAGGAGGSGVIIIEESY